jgi:hypothetical protein
MQVLAGPARKLQSRRAKRRRLDPQTERVCTEPRLYRTAKGHTQPRPSQTIFLSHGVEYTRIFTKTLINQIFMCPKIWDMGHGTWDMGHETGGAGGACGASCLYVILHNQHVDIRVKVHICSIMFFKRVLGKNDGQTDIIIRARTDMHAQMVRNDHKIYAQNHTFPSILPFAHTFSRSTPTHNHTQELTRTHRSVSPNIE